MNTLTMQVAIIMVLASSGGAAAETAAGEATRMRESGAAPAGTGTAADADTSGTPGTGAAMPAGASTQAAASVPEDQVNFLMKAALSGMAEIELARIALERSKNPDVRQHAQHMLDDHGKANATLKAIAAEKNVPLPDQLTGVRQQMVEKLRNSEAVQFDEAYMQAEVEEHKAAVGLFRTAMETSKDSRLQSFAAQTLPTLERHLDEALQITNKIASR